MDKHVLLVVVVLLIVSTQAHNQNPRERSSSSSSGTSSSVVSSLATINAGDPPVVSPLDPAVNLRRSSSIHDADADADVDLIDGYTGFQPSVSSSAAGSATFAGSTTSSKSIDNTIHLDDISGASSSDETGDAASSTSSQSESERASQSTIALNRSSTFTTSSSRQASSTLSSFDIFKNGSSYSAGTVSLNEERSNIESTKLELSTSHEASSFHSSRSTKKATSNTDPASDGDDANKNNSSKDLTSSNLSSRNPILYACAVLAVAGLAGGVFAVRIKRKRDDECIVSESSPRHDPLPSQVHVIIDDNHFALL